METNQTGWISEKNKEDKNKKEAAKKWEGERDAEHVSVC